MRPRDLSRRGVFGAAFAALGILGLGGSAPVRAASAELRLPVEATETRVDFDTADIATWTVVGGQWALEPSPGGPPGKRALVQRATRNAFNVIVAPPGPYGDVDVSVRFHPISGREDASGGIVLRFDGGRYYVVRANALEGNFRLYAYDRGRRELASAPVKPPALAQWHGLRIVAVGDHIQAWLNGALLLDRRDSRFAAGRVGLWTKADSVTAFDALIIRGVPREGRT